jgi:hypothetical protein
MKALRGPGFLILLVVSALAGAALVWKLTSKPASPPLTDEALSLARAKWKAAGLSDYHMTITVTSRERNRHEIEVRGGQVHQMKTDGLPAPERVWKFWSVDGMLTVLEEELANRRSPQAALGVNDPADVFLDAAFDEKTGVPIHYLRQVSGRPKLTMEWQISGFSSP